MKFGRIGVIIVAATGAVIALSIALAVGDSTAVPDLDFAPPGQYPVADTPVELTGFIPGVGFIPDTESNAVMAYVAGRTNIHVNWIQSNKLTARDEISLLLAGEEYPGIIQGASGSGLSMEDLVRYGSRGIILPLNQLIEDHGYHIKEMFDAVPGIKAAITARDGNIYGLPAVFTDDYHMTMRQKLWINREWIDRLGLDLPTTTEDFYAVMVAFRDRDANGNGDPTDEVPMTGARRSLEDLAMWIMNAFVPAGGSDESGDAHLNNYEFIIDGKVSFSANTPEFREGLRYIRRLYDEDLFHIAALTQDRIQIRPLLERDEVQRVGAVASHHPGNFTTIGDDPTLPFRQYVALPPITGPEGVGHTPWFSDAIIEQGQFVITDAVESPEAAIRLGDFYYSLEFAEVEKGIEGVHWRRVEPEEALPAIGGGVARYEYLKTLVPEDNAQINLGPIWTRNLKNEYARSDGFSYEEMLHRSTLPYEPYKVRVFPYSTISIATGAIEEFNDLRRTIHTYVGESVDRFIIGELDIDRDWETYLRHLNRLGLPRYREMLHAAYVRLERGSP